jgi:general secretion pathway protein I
MPVKGFTLLEVMVALAIFATAALALTKVAMQYTQSTTHNIVRTQAQFIASNEAAFMQIRQEWMTGTSSRQLTQQGQTWRITKRAEATISPNVQRIEIQVALVDQMQNVSRSVSSMTFFNHRVASQ